MPLNEQYQNWAPRFSALKGKCQILVSIAARMEAVYRNQLEHIDAALPERPKDLFRSNLRTCAP